MAEISLVASGHNQQTRTKRLSVQGGKAPHKKPRLKIGLLDDTGNVTITLSFDGRTAWALDQLLRAGTRGCTPLRNPAPRWSHYVWKLRRAGIAIETHHELHGGAYAGHHARYQLRSHLAVFENSFDAGRQP